MGSLDRLLRIISADKLYQYLSETEYQEYQSLKSQIEKNQEIVDRLKAKNDFFNELIKTKRASTSNGYNNDAHYIIQKILGGEK